MSDTMNLIKDLRSKTGAGFLDCKKALSENNNNLDEAIEYLRKKGIFYYLPFKCELLIIF